VLVTGASGFIGGRLVEALVEAGTDVVTIRREASPERALSRSVVADYASIPSLEAVVSSERPDYVLHLAGVTKGVRYEDFWRGNVLPTRNLLSACESIHAGLERFVLVSSLASYGPSTLDRPHRETDPREPIEHYGRSKLEAELAVEDSSLRSTILRPGGVYGQGDVDYFQLFQSAMRGINAYFGNRDRRMSLIHVDDCVRGIVQAAAHPDTVGKGYFLETEESVSWEELQSLIVDVVGTPARTVDCPEGFVSLAAFGGELASRIDRKPRLLNLQKAKMGAQRAWTCTADAARADFGFDKTVELVDGLRRTHEWYADQGWYTESGFVSLLGGFLRSFGGDP